MNMYNWKDHNVIIALGPTDFYFRLNCIFVFKYKLCVKNIDEKSKQILTIYSKRFGT